MGYEFLAVRDGESDDGALYPVLGGAGESTLIELEPLDGSVSQHPVKAIYVKRLGGSKVRYLKRVPDIKAVLYITDARVALACEKFDKGGGWIGFSLSGMATAAAANAVSRARASRRRRGKLLVGQVRYPWLGSVLFTSKSSGFLMPEEVSFRTNVTEGGQKVSLELSVQLPKGSAPAVAHAVATRCAAYRLRHAELTDEQRDELTQLLERPALAPQPKKTMSYTMGPFWRVSAGRAYPAQAPVASPTPSLQPSETPTPTAAPPPGPAATSEPAAPSRIEIGLDDLD